MRSVELEHEAGFKRSGFSPSLKGGYEMAIIILGVDPTYSETKDPPKAATVGTEQPQPQSQIGIVPPSQAER
jgi:hypothetical protein